MLDMDLAPTLAECQREAAEEACQATGHVLDESEDGVLFCDRCGVQALDVEEPEQVLCRHYAGPECGDCRG